MKNNRYAEYLLQNYYYSNFSMFRDIELIISGDCNLNCKYCYLWKNKNNILPSASDEKVLANLELVLNWIEKNQFKTGLSLFSGELFAQSLGFKTLDIIYEHQVKLEPEQRLYRITIPTNFTFICSDELTTRVEEYLKKFADLGVPLLLSASVDGALIEDNRPHSCELDIPLKVIRDDAYYEKLFAFCRKYYYKFHPMIHSQHIDKWIDNYEWYKQMLLSHDMHLSDLYLLEVRNEEWTQEDIKEFQKFLEYLQEDLWNIAGGDSEKYLELLFSHEESFNILSSFLKGNDRGLGCSLQTELCIRLTDLAVPPCHRTAYPQFLYGYFVPDEENILRFESENIEIMSMILGLSIENMPYCAECPINTICTGQCIGAMYESHRNLIVPIPSVCALEHAKLVSYVEFWIKKDIYRRVLARVPRDRAKQFEYIRRTCLC